MEQASIHQQKTQILPAIDALFVESYKTIIVLTKNSLRVYNSSNGRMIRIIQGITSKGQGDLCCMTLDDKHRMLYVGDTRGGIRVFNVSNGALISCLEASEQARNAINEQAGSTNKELCALRFFSAPSDNQKPNQMLITGQGNSRVSCWDVNKVTETDLIRSVSGEKVFHEDILTIAASEHHCLIATGGVNGTICLWDFELFRLDKVLLGNRGGVTFLAFAEQYPLLVSCTQQGVISLFTIRSASELKNRCIARFVNLIAGPDGIMRNCGITCASLTIKPNLDFDPNSNEANDPRFFKTAIDDEGSDKFESPYCHSVNDYVLTFPLDQKQFT
jgi:WD40 repeat protein